MELYDESIEDFNKALEWHSTNPGIYSGLGQSYRLLNQLDKALLYLNDALKDQPNNHEFLV